MRALAVLVLVGFILVPLLQAVILSFTATLGDGSLGLMNYAAVLAAPELRAAMLNSLVYVVLNVALCIAVALPAAYALARYRFTGDRHFLLAILVFRVTPPVVLSLPIFILFSQFGLVNSPVGIRSSPAT
jgi:glycerol transport system permease protein